MIKILETIVTQGNMIRLTLNRNKTRSNEIFKKIEKVNEFFYTYKKTEENKILTKMTKLKFINQ